MKLKHNLKSYTYKGSLTMKKMTKLSLISTLLLSLTNLNAENAEDILNQAEQEQASQSVLNQTEQGQASQGESLFLDKNKNRTSNNPTNDFLQQNFSNNDLNNASNHRELFNDNEKVQSYEGEINEEQLALMKAAIRNQNLNALQGTFFTKKYQGFENTKNLNFEMDKTQKIRTRFAMATTLIFETDIQSYILGDNTGFKIEEIPNLPNALAIKPLLIGIDTSLTIFTKDNKLHTFYLYSTDYKSNKDPDLIVYIKDDESKKEIEEKKERLEKDYLVIKEGITEVKVKRSDIYKHYKQKTKKENEWLLAEEIFNDKQFTYFKYDKDKMPQIPSIFVVIDNQDSPIETRTIGNYIIAETTAQKFTIMLGNSHVCVEKIELENKNLKKIDTEVEIHNYK